MRSFIKRQQGDQIKGIAGECSTHEGEEKCIYNFSRTIRKEEIIWKI
jgi:hypothetical protein